MPAPLMPPPMTSRSTLTGKRVSVACKGGYGFRMIRINAASHELELSSAPTLTCCEQHGARAIRRYVKSLLPRTRLLVMPKLADARELSCQRRKLGFHSRYFLLVCSPAPRFFGCLK